MLSEPTNRRQLYGHRISYIQKGLTIMRKWTEIVKPYPQLRRGRPYRVRVIDIGKEAGSKTIEVTLEFLESNQKGRRIRGPLTLPIRPDGPTADYFRSCHLEIRPQARISPRDTINCEIIARFEQATAGESWQPIHFEPISQGEENEPVQSESAEHRSDVFTAR